MRIGVDASSWVNGRGYGRYTRELLRAMVALAPEHEFVFLCDASAREGIDLASTNLRFEVVELRASPTDAARTGSSRAPSDMLRMSRAVRRSRPDVFLCPTVYTFFPLPPGQPAVTVVHDVIAERFPELTLPTFKDRLFWRMKVGLALRQSRLLLTSSPYSAGEIAEVLRFARERIRVALAAPAPAYAPGAAGALGGGEELAAARARLGLPAGSRWFVYVGGFNPHKNVDLCVRAHAALCADLDDPPHLLLVGPRAASGFHDAERAIEAAIERGGYGERVHWTGFVADDELRHLHAASLGLLLPSRVEGFGLPAVEAAACGAPVVATTRSPLPELLEGGGYFVEPGDEAALLAAMRTLATDADARARLGARAAERAGALTWPAAGRAALEALEEAAG